jgi:hypothetical protein
MDNIFSSIISMEDLRFRDEQKSDTHMATMNGATQGESDKPQALQRDVRKIAAQNTPNTNLASLDNEIWDALELPEADLDEALNHMSAEPPAVSTSNRIQQIDDFFAGPAFQQLQPGEILPQFSDSTAFLDLPELRNAPIHTDAERLLQSDRLYVEPFDPRDTVVLQQAYTSPIVAPEKINSPGSSSTAVQTPEPYLQPPPEDSTTYSVHTMSLPACEPAPFAPDADFKDYLTDIFGKMMFVSGETAEASAETTWLIEEIVREQVVHMVSRPASSRIV